jgi:hypothetical protein
MLPTRICKCLEVVLMAYVMYASGQGPPQATVVTRDAIINFTRADFDYPVSQTDYLCESLI